MITGMEIYWMTRCDSIKEALQVGGGIGGSIGLLVIAIWLVSRTTNDGVTEWFNKGGWILNYCVCGYLLVILSCFIPTNKEVAMIKVIPAIANNETIQTECKDLYKLAKQGLTDLVTDDTK
jgi:ammonia channel protein AmtB